MTYTITDRDVRMFLREAPQYSGVKRALSFAAIPLVAALVIAGGFAYFAPGHVISQAPVIAPSTANLPVADATPTPAPAITQAAVVATPAPTPTPLPVTLANNTFAAADLKISAPITWNVGFDDKDMNDNLQNGLIHIAGTALPGQKGMAAIAGHSSNYPWVKGNFNSVFAPLTKAKAGQVFEINYQNTMYRYQVTKVYEVKPDQVTVLGDNSMTGIRLITCTPVGTSLRRLIVEAQQIFPDPSTAAPFNGGTFNGSLPSDQ